MAVEDRAADADVDTDGEGEEADEHTPFLRGRRESNHAAAPMTDDAQGRALSIDPLAPSSAFDETLRDRLREDAQRQDEDAVGDDEDEEDDGPVEGTSRTTRSASRRDSERLLERRWVAPPGKRIAVPVRIEPKVYFAVERTFLV